MADRPDRRRYLIAIGVSAVILLTGGCTGIQSTLDPAGIGAERVASLFWVMLTGAGIIWVMVMAIAIHAARRKRPISLFTAKRFIIAMGAIFPTVVLTALLVHGLRLMPELRTGGGDLTIEVVGEQFWWRVVYHPPAGHPAAGTPVVSANELRLPAGAEVDLVLNSPDVIHSFWIPAIGGKIDMIPGRTTRLTLKPTRPGIYRGACAEFCGTAHALMALTAEVMPQADFDRWLADQAGPARTPAPGTPAARGARVFADQGCGACHSVRGTEAQGRIGPDLTRIGGRHSIGAGILPNTPARMADFISATTTVKPGVLMPPYGMLAPQALADLSAYLESLE
ncbi:cytochrome c oxidase subunit II (plasmid) [Tistrella bauzanensis]|uniref:Cytochrome aa3 subunit 2 n=1 Tax=Tistrella arctica TaxID=3133430 RepID=A0ABU9YLI4_9PROT